MKKFAEGFRSLLIPVLLTVFYIFLGKVSVAQADTIGLNQKITREAAKYGETLYPLYQVLHQNPELSGLEAETSVLMASALSGKGFEVTTGVGGYGVVGVFRNGKGPVVLLRTDMDALPVKETTNLPFASRKMVQNRLGEEVPVMHACGHDMHMAVWLGTLSVLVGMADSWSGTLLAVAQPSEETGGGSLAMLGDGLYSRFPQPDYGLAFHVSSGLPAGQIGYHAGNMYAGSRSVDLIIHGKGGHGAMPHTTIDPIVLASQMVLAFQTIVSRTVNPLDNAVVTVGSIHGGTKYNIIPDEVKLQLTIRFFKESVLEKIQQSLKTISHGLAISAGLPEDKMPEFLYTEHYTPPVYNDPALVNQAVTSMKSLLGEENLIMSGPTMSSEDFGRYGQTGEKVPVAIFWLGSVNIDRYREFTLQGETLPSLHNSGFYPDFFPAWQTGVCAMARTIMDLMHK